jgi:NAD(P)H-hydrate epimerase
MLTFTKIKVLDLNSEYLGVSTLTLMENAGFVVADEVARNFGEGKRIAVLCGTGNNGGDGFVAARYLMDRNDVKVLLVRPASAIRSYISRVNLEKVEEMANLYQGEDLGRFDMIIDAIYGTGLEGDIKDPGRTAIEKINASGAIVVSVDVPSGLGTPTAVRPYMTVTMHDVKEGMTEANSGRIVIRDIGIPEEAVTHVGPGEFLRYPAARPDSRKGENGRVLVIGGGPYTGAPFLAAMGAYRIGVDLVKVAAPAECARTIAGYSPSMIVHPLPGSILTEADVETALAVAEEADAVVIGPGLGRDARTMIAVRDLVSQCRRPMVIDADAFHAFSKDMAPLKGKQAIITPHTGEFESLSGSRLPDGRAGRADAARKLAAILGVTVLLKGPTDIITDGADVNFNKTGNAGMTVGGTGDVLAGVCVGLLAKGVKPMRAARMAAFATGMAGDLAFDKFSYGMLATDVVDQVPVVLKRCLEGLK